MAEYNTTVSPNPPSPQPLRAPARSDPRAQTFLNTLSKHETTGFDHAGAAAVDRVLNAWAPPDEEFPRPPRAYGLLEPADRRAWAAEVRLWLGASTEPPAPRPAVVATKVPKRSAATAAPPPPAKPVQRSREVSLDTPLDAITGVRRDLAGRLAKLGVTTPREALRLYPRRHLNRTETTDIASLQPGSQQTVLGFVWSATATPAFINGRRLFRNTVVIGDTSGNIEIVMFNKFDLARSFKPQRPVMVSGKVNVHRGRLQIASPEYEFLDDPEADLGAGLIPVYPLTEGLGQRPVRRLVKQMVTRFADALPDPLPEAVRQRHGFQGIADATRAAHYPDSVEAYERARARLAFDELLLMQLGALNKRQQWLSQHGYAIRPEPSVLAGFRASLPFRLTGAQERVLHQVLSDLAAPQPMSRLVQGDVGSGKTVVAAAALVAGVAAGYQGAIMAPTEILAEQHYRNLSRLFGHDEFAALENLPLPYLGRPLRLGLLTGSSGARERRRVTEGAASGELDLLVGTHALIQEGVTFHNLAIAVIDEQHRFGVAQRASLRQKGHNPHVLVMTATPIPRTLALTLYGDLESSVIDEMPPGRQPIATAVLAGSQRTQAYQAVRREVQAGRQVYLICPLVEESATVEARAATVEHARLASEVFPDLRLGLLHGRMTPTEKDAVMAEFRDGAVDILVSTTVIEVGIDVPNATMMVIEGADRFGLSQLHQLRGRVGRGAHQSYCLLVTESVSVEAQERLKIGASTNDGFKLAEEDLRLRGPGEFFGTRQTGLPDLRMARLDDWALLQAAREEAQEMLKADPGLDRPEHHLLRADLERLQPRSQTDRS